MEPRLRLACTNAHSRTHARAAAMSKLAGMLGMSADRQREREAQQRQRDAVQKKQREEAAKARKKAREQEAARVAEIEANLTPSQPRTSPTTAEKAQAVVDAYLDNPPYYGASKFENNKTVVEYCRGADGRSSAPPDKSAPGGWAFGTRDPLAVVRLLKAGIWSPRGVHPPLWGLLEQTIAAREAASSAAAEVASRARAEASVQAAGHKTAEELRAEEEARESLRRARAVEEDTPEELARCAALGVSPAAVQASSTWEELGPCSNAGLSLAGRVLRILDLFDDPKVPYVPRLVEAFNRRAADKDSWKWYSLDRLLEAIADGKA